MKQNLNKLLWILVLVNLAVSGILVYRSFFKSFDKQQALKYHTSNRYMLYVGTSISPENKNAISEFKKAHELADGIVLKYLNAFTSWEADGGWTSNTGELYHEKTIVYDLYDVSDEKIKEVLNEMLVTFNQQCILVNKSYPNVSFYEGQTK